MSRRRKPQHHRPGRAHVVVDELAAARPGRYASIHTHVIVRTAQGDLIRMTRQAWQATR